MKISKFLPMLTFTLLLQACNSSIQIEGIDSNKWKEDYNGCNGYRKQTAEYVFSNRDQLKKFKEGQLIDFLGKPDRIHPSTRGKSYQIWFIEEGAQCSNTNKKSAARLVMEFDFLGNLSIVRKSYLD